MTPAAQELALQLCYIIPGVAVVFAVITGIVLGMAYLYDNGPWWCRVLFFIPLLIVNIIGLLCARSLLINMLRSKE